MNTRLEFNGTFFAFLDYCKTVPENILREAKVSVVLTSAVETDLQEKARQAVRAKLDSDDRQFGKLPAIKLVREITTMGLKEAKDFVEAWLPESTWNRYRYR